MRKNLGNIVLRGAALGGRFVLLLAISQYLSPKALGVYGVFSVTVSLALLALGLEFYTFNTREILDCSPRQRVIRLRDQLVFHAIAYLFILPLLLLPFLGGIMEWKHIGWFYAVLITEHFSQEIYRVLIALSRSVQANFVYFIRAGAWVGALAILYWWNPSARQLNWVWMLWWIGGVLSVATGAFFLRHMCWTEAWSHPVQWSWIRRGLSVAFPFMLASLAMRGMVAADRYFLEYYRSDEVVGVYTLYYSISNLVQIFVDTGVAAVLYPKMVEAYNREKMREYRALFRKLASQVTSVGLLIALAMGSSIYPILWILDNPLYLQDIKVYWILLIAAIVAGVGLIPHYALYACREDQIIIGSVLAGLLVSLAVNALLVQTYGMMGAAVAYLSAMTVITGIKFIAWLNKSSKLTQKTYKK